MENAFKHIMVDLETLDTRNTSAILSIAAVKFNLSSGIFNQTFRINIDLQDCLDQGMTIGRNTIYWWLEQSSEAGNRVSHNLHPLKFALKQLYDFMHGEYYVWGNSARFDLSILENAYNVVELDKPWKHINERDVRTLVSLNPDIKAQHVFIGLKHDPLDDCINQITYCSKIFNSLVGK